jgi:hypothetical protein
MVINSNIGVVIVTMDSTTTHLHARLWGHHRIVLPERCDILVDLATGHVSNLCGQDKAMVCIQNV